MKGFTVEKCLFLNDFHAVRNHCPEKAGMGKSLPSDGLDSLRDHDFSAYSVGVEIPQAAVIIDKEFHHLFLPGFRCFSSVRYNPVDILKFIHPGRRLIIAAAFLRLPECLSFFGKCRYVFVHLRHQCLCCFLRTSF